MGLLAIIFWKNCRKGCGVVPIKKNLLQFFIFFIFRQICNMFSAMTYISVFSYPFRTPVTLLYVDFIMLALVGKFRAEVI